MKKFWVWTLLLAMLLTAVPMAASADCSHSWEIIGGDPAPTCESEGYNIVRCRKCGETERKYAKPLDHDMYDLEVLETPTCAKEGTMRTKCRNCIVIGWRIIPKTDHDWKVTKHDKPNCSKDGSIFYKCSHCSDEYGLGLPRNDDHNYSWKVTAEATENSKGTRIGTCADCGKKITEQFYPEGTLYRGVSNRNAVKQLQEKLIALGYLKDVADGVFGKNTEQAVKDFQTTEGLLVDGIAWPETLKLLDARSGGQTDTNSSADNNSVEYTVDDIMIGGGVVSTGNVNLRSGPGLDYAIVGTVNKDFPLGRVLASAVDNRGIVWFMVNYKGTECWVSTVYSKLYIGNIDYSVDRLPFPKSELYPSEYYLLDGGMELMNYYMCNFDIVCSALYLEDVHEGDGGLRYTSNWALTVEGHEYSEYFVLTDGSYTVYGAKLGMNIEEVKELFVAEGLYFSEEGGYEEIREYHFLRSYQADSLYADENGFDLEILVQTDIAGTVHTIFVRTLGMES